MTDRPHPPGSHRPRRVVFLPHWPDNPYQVLLASGLETLGVHVDVVDRLALFLPAIWRRGQPDVVHLHAPDHFVVYRRSHLAAAIALVLYFVQVALLRLGGARIVWTVHDLINHERRRPRVDALVRAGTARLAHAMIVHCEAARREVALALGCDPARLRVVPHGHYSSTYPDPQPTARAARAALGLPSAPLIVLFLGNLRRHKGLEVLIDAWVRLDRPNTRLVIAGAPFDDAIGQALEGLVTGRRDIDLRAASVPDADVATYLRAADVVVCPFTSSLTSGSLALALSFGKPVVASRLGCAVEMTTEAGGFLYDPTAPEGLLVALRAAVDARDRLAAIGEANRSRMQQCDWSSIARQTLAAYDEASG